MAVFVPHKKPDEAPFCYGAGAGSSLVGTSIVDCCFAPTPLRSCGVFSPTPAHAYFYKALWVTFRLVLEKKAHFEGSTSTSGLTSTVLHPHYLPPGPFPTQPRPAELSGELCCKIAPSNAPLHRPKLPVSLPWPDSPARYGQVLRAGASKTRPPMPTASLRACSAPGA